jgi:hypothetical protein
MGIPKAEEETDAEKFADDAFAELEDRSEDCVGCYPFAIKDSVLQTKEDLTPHWAYIFCLLLSYRGADRGEVGKRPTQLFEEVAAVAARRYVSGESIRFGFPRRVLPSNFIEAIKEVCGKLGEGEGPRQRPSSRHAKDAQLDIIAWRPFPDQRKAKLILFGQCAAGGNWEEKLSELQPANFIKSYLLESLAVDPLRCFFTPFRLRHDDWYEKAVQGGILFDRCRIAHFAYEQEPPPELTKWNNATQRAIKNS